MKVVRSTPLRTGRLHPQEFSWYSFLEAESTPGHMIPSVASKKIPSDTTGNGFRDLPISSAVIYHVSIVNVMGTRENSANHSETYSCAALYQQVDMKIETCSRYVWSTTVTGVACRPGEQMCHCQTSLDQCNV
jgi:hypothetical protein